MNRLLALFLLIAGPVAAAAQGAEQDESEIEALSDSLGLPYHMLRDGYIGGVTIIHLVANPDEYDGRVVQAEGLFSYQFEDVSLRLSDAEGLNSGALSVWVSFADECIVRRYDLREILPCNAETVGSLDGKRILLTGRFNRHEHGHMGQYFGGIGEVSQLSEFP